MKLATTILQLLASILLFSKTLTPTSPYPQHSCLGRLLDPSWHLPIPVPLAKFPWDDMPTSLRSSTITATTTTNITLPDPNEVSYGIYLFVDLGNSSSFNANDTALLNPTVLPALSPVLDDDSLCYSVSTCASDDLNSVLSFDFSPGTVFSIESFTGTAFDFPVVKRSVTRYFLDDDDVSSDLFIASDCRVILPVVVECALPKMRQSC